MKVLYRENEALRSYDAEMLIVVRKLGGQVAIEMALDGKTTHAEDVTNLLRVQKALVASLLDEIGGDKQTA